MRVSKKIQKRAHGRVCCCLGKGYIIMLGAGWGGGGGGGAETDVRRRD